MGESLLCAFLSDAVFSNLLSKAALVTAGHREVVSVHQPPSHHSVLSPMSPNRGLLHAALYNLHTAGVGIMSAPRKVGSESQRERKHY